MSENSRSCLKILLPLMGRSVASSSGTFFFLFQYPSDSIGWSPNYGVQGKVVTSGIKPSNHFVQYPPTTNNILSNIKIPNNIIPNNNIIHNNYMIPNNLSPGETIGLQSTPHHSCQLQKKVRNTPMSVHFNCDLKIEIKVQITIPN